MFAHAFVVALFFLAGIVSLLAALFNWEWFFRTRNMQFLLLHLGEKGTRLFYAVTGTALIGMATYLLSHLFF